MATLSRFLASLSAEYESSRLDRLVWDDIVAPMVSLLLIVSDIPPPFSRVPSLS